MKNHFLYVKIPVIALAFLLLGTQAFAGPVSHFGALKRCTKNICGEKTGQSTPIFFKGPSLYWSDGSGVPFYNIETVDWFVDNMQIGIIRAAMAIRWYGNGSEEVNKPGGIAGYLVNNKAAQKNYIKKVIDAAIANDIYVIVDWHSHVAHQETSEATTFFREIATEYPNCPNIVWEVYNEPINASESQVSSHANTIISAIRAAGNNNLVIIGSPSYSKKPKEQASDWGSSRDQNVAFAFHFYAASHAYPSGDGIGNSANGARDANNAVFGSEWGAVNYDGKGDVNANATNTWTEWMDNNKISNCMWNASSLDEGSSMFTNGTGISNLSTSRLRPSGTYFQTYMSKNKWTAQIPSNHPRGNDVVKSVKDGNSITLNATDLGLDGEISEVSEPEFGSASKTANSITYTTSSKGSPNDKVKFFYKITKGSVTVKSKITINITDRKPVLPEKAPIAVSRKAPTEINIVSTLSVQDPTGQGVEFDAVSVTPSTIGTVAITSNKGIATFTPAASQSNVELAEATFNYTVKSKNGGSNSSSVILQLKNFAPTIRATGGTFAPSVPNTESVGIGMAQNRFSGKDPDGDAISFKQYYLHPQYPGRLELVKPDSLVYYPDAGKIGKVTFLAVITDGSLDSPLGGLSLTLTGSGTDIGNLPAPTEIPGYVEPPIDPIDPIDPIEPPVFAYQASNAKNMSLAFGFGKIELYLAQSGVAKLDVYSLSGKKMGSLLNGHQNAGSKEISLKSLNLQKGIYILRLSQGSQVKTLRVVK